MLLLMLCVHGRCSRIYPPQCLVAWVQKDGSSASTGADQPVDDRGFRAEALTLPLPNMVGFFDDLSRSPLFALSRHHIVPAFASRAVRHAVEFKWEKFGRRFVLLHMLQYFLYLSLFSILTLSSLASDAIADSGSSNGIAHTVLEAVFLAACAYYLQKEAWQMWREKLSTYLSSAWNVLDICGYSLALAGSVMRITHSDSLTTASREVDSVTAILLWSKTLSFAIGFRSTGPFVGTLLQTLKPIGFFLLCLIVVILGFSHALHLLTAPLFEDSPTDIIYSGWNSIYRVYFSMLGDFDISELLRSLNPGLAVSLMALFSLLATIVMLNVLIALLNDIYQRVSLSAENEWYLERCRIMMDIESSLSVYKNSSEWFPKWLQVLEPLKRSASDREPAAS